jgi:hypothetical protein
MRDIERELEETWRDADLEAARLKDSQYALRRLLSLVERLDGEDRREAERVVTAWALSDDRRKQFDAVALIGELRVKFALPALRELAERFERSDEPSAAYDWAWVNRVIARLGDEARSVER